MARRESDDLLNPIDEKTIITGKQRPNLRLDKARKGYVDFAVGFNFQYLNL